jgi:hypothetical protein
MSRLDKFTPEQIVKAFISLMKVELQASCFDDFTDSEIVKAYTRLMLTCESKLAILMAQVDVSFNVNSLETIAAAIKEWCKNVKSQETTFSVELNVENRLSIINVDEKETSEVLVKAFLEGLTTVRGWDSYQLYVDQLKIQTWVDQ